MNGLLIQGPIYGWDIDLINMTDCINGNRNAMEVNDDHDDGSWI